MANYNEIYKSSIDWANVFVRTSNFPLDRSSIFGSYEDALEYAKGTGSDERGLGGTSYVGQVIAVYENDTVRVYKIIGKDIYNEVTKTVEIKERGLEELISREDVNTLLRETEFLAKKIITDEKITIIGTPLGQIINPNNSLDVTIDPNNMQEILKMLFYKELYPTNVKFTEGTVEAIVSLPLITANYNENDVVEVGTEIIFNQIDAPKINYNTTDRILSGIEYGYSNSNNNLKEFSDTSIVREARDKKPSEGEHKLLTTYTTFVDAENLTYVNVSKQSLFIPEHSVKVDFGENILNVEYTGPKATAKFEKIVKLYYCSNLQNTNNENYFNGCGNDIIVAKKISTSSSSFKIIGKWFLYANGVNGTFDINSDFVRTNLIKQNLTDSGTITLTSSVPCENVVIAFPSEWGNLVSVKDNGSGTFITNNFISKLQTTDVSGANNVNSNIYKVYVYTPSKELENGFNYTITIN